MATIGITMLLRFQETTHSINACKDVIIPYLQNVGAENVALLPKGLTGAYEAELAFSFERPFSLDTVLAMLAQFRASLLMQYILLPSSLSGLSSPYDVRDYGDVVTSAVKSVEGVNHASLNSKGTLHIECRTLHLDKLLEQVHSALTGISDH